MPISNDPERPRSSSTSDAGILLDPVRVLGVDPLDPAGTLPADAKVNGITVIIPRWPDFPTGARVHTVNIYIVGTTTTVAQRDYRAADSAPEFFIPVAASSLPNAPSFEIFYIVRTPNPTTSPLRLLTFKVSPPVGLVEPKFPDANLRGYIVCEKDLRNPPDPEQLFIWEGIRIFIPFDNRFRAGDDIQLVWQCWANLNGSGPALTPPGTFSVQVNSEDISGSRDISMVIRPFNTWIEPMTADNSADATYMLVRNGIPIFSSLRGVVKVDRKIPGTSRYCSGPP